VVFVLQFLRILFVHEDFTNHEWTRIDANELIKFAACPAVARRAKEDTLVSILRLLSRRLWLRLCCSAFSRGYFSEAYSRFDRRTGVVAVRGTAHSNRTRTPSSRAPCSCSQTPNASEDLDSHPAPSCSGTGYLARPDNFDDEIAMAARHLAKVEVDDTRNGRQVFLRAGDHFVWRIGLGGISPEDDDVRNIGR
jgi:hypothetical protein